LASLRLLMSGRDAVHWLCLRIYRFCRNADTAGRRQGRSANHSDNVS
jgi:hypothetical protein